MSAESAFSAVVALLTLRLASRLFSTFLACFLEIFFTFDLLIARSRLSVPATAVPTSANESAITATIIAGDGRDF